MNLVKQKIEALQAKEIAAAQAEATRITEQREYADRWITEIGNRFAAAGIEIEAAVECVKDDRALFEAVYREDDREVRVRCGSAGDLVKKDGVWTTSRYEEYAIAYEGRWCPPKDMVNSIAQMLAEKYLVLLENEKKSAEFLGLDPGDEAELANDAMVAEAEERADAEALKTL